MHLIPLIPDFSVSFLERYLGSRIYVKSNDELSTIYEALLKHGFEPIELLIDFSDVIVAL
jgi:hypothetical protein